MKVWKEIFLLLIGLSPAAGALILYDRLPETMASHFGLNNEVNGTMSKGMMILILVLLGLVPLVMRLARTIDPKKTNYEKFTTAFEVKRFGSTLLLAVVGWVMIIYNLGHHVDILRFAMVSLGALFAVMGNYLTQVKINYMFGIRTPWTLGNEEVWRKTHRLGGPLMMIGGVIALITAFINDPVANVIFLLVIVITSLIPVFYSYVLYSRTKG
jgi:uncharacterized membrane protein